MSRSKVGQFHRHDVQHEDDQQVYILKDSPRF